MVKLCLTGNNCNNLCLMLKKQRNFKKDQDLTSLNLVVNLSPRPNKIKEIIQLIVDDKKAWDVLKTIHQQDIFLFTYDVWKLANRNSDFPDLRHDVTNFKSSATVEVEFQILLHNFKASKIVNAVKAYLFQLLGVYLIDNPMQSKISISNKRQHRDNKWMVMLPYIRRIKTSMYPLESQATFSIII